MKLEQRISAFVNLGNLFHNIVEYYENTSSSKENSSPYIDAFKIQINRATEFNGWFTKSNVLTSFKNWSESLQRKNLERWLSTYDLDENKASNRIAIIMAGNIPLVGFHDLLSVLITGNKAIVKLSTNDSYFLPLIAKYLVTMDPYFKDAIVFTDKNLKDFDAVIATGSNNTARYFDYYFDKYPSIIRQNRNGVAILTGKESKEELELLGEDIFLYFGLGCRSVSKLFVPKNYDFDKLFSALYKFKTVLNYKKYENNYDYNKAVYLMSLFKLVENGFIMLKEDASYGSPIATLFYEYYDDIDTLQHKLVADKEQIQCIASNKNVVDFVKFGQTQCPKLWNYADDIDTIEFLLNI